MRACPAVTPLVSGGRLHSSAQLLGPEEDGLSTLIPDGPAAIWSAHWLVGMEVARSIALFGVAAVAEIGGAYLVWQAVREGRPWWLALLGGVALFAYGFAATFQPTRVSAPF
jgi:Uncharacterised BCR, YnfA/UPF0060 family